MPQAPGSPPSVELPQSSRPPAAHNPPTISIPIPPTTLPPPSSSHIRSPLRRASTEQDDLDDPLTGVEPPQFHPANHSPEPTRPPPTQSLNHPLLVPPSHHHPYGADRRNAPSPLNRIHYQNRQYSSNSDISQMASAAPYRPPPSSLPPPPTPHATGGADLDDSRVAMLLSAASRGNVDRVLSLLHGGMSPSACDYDRRTALHVAASDGALEVVKVLIEEGASLNERDRFGHTPLDEAVAYQHASVAELLMFYNAEHGDLARLEAQLITAAAANDLNAARALLSSGVPATCFDYDRRTPLHLAVSEGHIEMAKLLLQYKADPMAEDRWGSSPLTELQRRLTRTGNDPMRDVFTHLMPPTAPVSLWSKFAVFYSVWEVIFICLMGGFARYDTEAAGYSDTSQAAQDGQRLNFATLYPLYQDVHVMIFIGFAYLMVFLRKHGYTSVGGTFLIAALVIQWYQLTRGFWYDAFHGTWDNILISITTLVQADFCAGAVLITFGVVLGKVSPSQMLCIALVETVFYSLNEAIGLTLQVADLGGTMTIHCFGAFFGMAVSLVVTPKSALGNQNNAAVYHSDLMAMIGTIFLWMFWPSFNAALGVGTAQPRAVINTLLSIAASCVVAFIASYALRRNRSFAMVDVQNATLAGGVAMGACCDLLIYPGSAMAIGAIAGFVSVVGFVYVQPWLEARLGLHDTCGVNNLHGMPSIIGGVASIIAAAVATDTHYSNADYASVFGDKRAGDRSAGLQALYQLIYLGTSIGIGVGAGLFCGILARLPFFEPPADDKTDDVFQDDRWWEVPHLELPYFFDRRGEISRGAGNLAQVNVAIADGSGGGETVDPAIPSGELPSKARYQRLLESKLDGLRQEMAALKRQQRSTREQPMAYTRPVSPVMGGGGVAAEFKSSPTAASPHTAGPPAGWGGHGGVGGVGPPPHPGYGWPYFSYPQPYYGHGPGTYAAAYQPTNNHNPIIPPDVSYPGYAPHEPRTGYGTVGSGGTGSVTGVGQGAPSASSSSQMDALAHLLTRLLTRTDGSASDASTAASSPTTRGDVSHKEL